MTPKNEAFLQIANLRLMIDARDSGFKLAVPSMHVKFLIPDGSDGRTNYSEPDRLNFRVKQTREDISKKINGKAICITDIWELRLLENGDYLFSSPRQQPKRIVIIDRVFKLGEIIGDFSSVRGQNYYPLNSIDIRIVINWLASKGDCILHAGGIAYGGKGYCFIGPSGAGKSTLVSALANNTDVTILGEDQIILRFIKDCFWIFGTPWHERSDRSAPIGVPLEKIFFLDRNQPQASYSLSAMNGIEKILQTAFIPYYLPEKTALIVERLALLGEQIPYRGLHYRLGEELLSCIISIS